MKKLVIILITTFTLCFAGILYATHSENEKKGDIVTEYVHMGQLHQPMPGFAF